MKIAICLSGQPRDLDKSLPTIKSNLIDVNKEHQIDIFAHIWFDESLIGLPFNSSQQHLDGKVGCWDEYTIDKIKTLNLKDWYYEKPKKFTEFSNLQSPPEAKQTTLASLFYSIYQANLMREFYESKEGTYDLVIRSRFDNYFKAPVIFNDFSELCKEQVVLSTTFQEVRAAFPFNGSMSMDDLFAIGNSENMSKYASVFPNFRLINHSLNQMHAKPYAENYLGHWLRTINSVRVTHSKLIDFTLARSV